MQARIDAVAATERSSTGVNERRGLFFSLSVAGRAEQKGECLENPSALKAVAVLCSCQILGTLRTFSTIGHSPLVFVSSSLWTSLVYTNIRT